MWLHVSILWIAILIYGYMCGYMCDYMCGYMCGYMLSAEWLRVRASNNFISISYHKFLFNVNTSFKFNWHVLLLRKTISRQRTR